MDACTLTAVMRSLLSQFQTPMATRSAVGFFGSGSPMGRPANLITQPTSDRQSIRMPTFSAIDGRHTKNKIRNCQGPAVVQSTQLQFTSYVVVSNAQHGAYRCLSVCSSIIHSFSTE